MISLLGLQFRCKIKNLTTPLRFSSKAWIQRHKNDSYVKKAVEGDLRSRSAFKLIQIQKEFKLINKDSYVVDLGSAPGGWSVACSEFLNFQPADFIPPAKIIHQRTSTAASVAPKKFGFLCSVDLLPMKLIPGDTHFIQGDFRSHEVQSQIEAVGLERGHFKVDCVLSDMLENMTGQHDIDHHRSIELSMAILLFCSHSLKPGGSILCKFLRGRDDKDLIAEASELFESVRLVKPKASRNESTEIYLYGSKKRQVIRPA